MSSKKLAVAILVVVLVASVFAAPSRKTSFDGRAAYAYVKALAADEMLGRKSGEPGGEKASAYVASMFKEWGVEPAGPKGSYFQDMTYEYYEVERGAALSVVAHNRTRDFIYGEDWRQSSYSGSAAAGAGLVFVGYGISAPQKDYDDFAGVDVKGKLVLFARETPRRFQDTLKDEAQLQSRVQAAQDRGALGVLMFQSDSSQQGYGFFRGGLKKEIYRPGFLILSVESKVVDFIFKWQKADPRYFFQQIEATGKPQSYDLGAQALVNLKAVFDEKRPTRNVLAEIGGSDPKLKSECVIVGAHMDHLGVDMSGDVFNGADDNASGTAVVMEAARVLKRNGFRPKRTIVFALWAAEEEGLLGSKHYTENPVYPLEKTVANINLDMQGHGTGKVGVRGAYYAPEVWEVLKARLPKAVFDNVVPGRGGPGGSDHTHFLYNGVPAFMVGTDGPHFKTNRVGDVIDLIQPEILKASGDFTLAALEALSTDPGVPIVPGRKETFYWRYQTIVNHLTPTLDEVIAEHGGVQDPDVDFQLAAVEEKPGLSGDALRADMLKSLMAGKDKLAASKGLALYGGQASAGGFSMWGRGPFKTTVVVGLRGLAALRDDPRWAEVFAKQGVSFAAVDAADPVFAEAGLSEDGRKMVESLGKTSLVLVARGLNPAQAKALLENAKRPICLVADSLPEQAVLDLVKKSESVVGLMPAESETAAAYVKRLDEAKQALGSGCVAIVNRGCLWEKAGKDAMLGVIAELLKLKYEATDLANLFSGSLQRALTRASQL